MAVTGWKTCGTVVDDSSAGSLTWGQYSASFGEGPTLAGTELSADDGSIGVSGNAAGVGFSSNAFTHWLKCTNFGFTTSDVPSGATIDGIEIEFRKARIATTAFVATDVKIVQGGTISGSDISTQTDWSTSETADTFGGATEKGGLTILDSDVRNSNFGCALTLQHGTSRIAPSGDAAYVDQCRIRVYYTAGAATKAPPPPRRAMRFFRRR